MLLLLLSSCASVIGDYDLERTDALRDPPPAPPDWEPDLRLRISQPTLQQLGTAALEAGLSGADSALSLSIPLGGRVEIHPSATVTGLSLAVSDACDGCLALDARLKGTAKWTAGPLDGTVPFTSKVSATMSFQLAEQGSGWGLSGTIVDVDRFELGNVRAGSFDVTDLLAGWTQDVIEQIPPIPIGQLGGDELPLRAARLATVGGNLAFEGLTLAPEGSPLTTTGGELSEGWELALSQDTVLSLMRRAAFKKGPLSYDTAIDPRSLSVDGDQLQLTVRIWRLVGRGWWREYDVVGTVAVDNGKLAINPEKATEGDKSKGAGLAEPLALLAEGRILEAVEDGVRQAFPATRGADLGALKVKATAATARGEDGALLVTGDLSTSAAGSRGSSQRDGDGKKGDGKKGDGKKGDGKKGDGKKGH